MYALKFGHLVMEKTDAEVYNFYIDMRTPHKGYEEFYHRLLDEGMHFVRGGWPRSPTRPASPARRAS